MKVRLEPVPPFGPGPRAAAKQSSVVVQPDQGVARPARVRWSAQPLFFRCRFSTTRYPAQGVVWSARHTLAAPKSTRALVGVSGFRVQTRNRPIPWLTGRGRPPGAVGGG